MRLKSLSVRTLLKMSIRITLIVLIVTCASYFHLMHTIEIQTKDTLTKYTKEREAREQIIFDEARENHEAIKTAFLLRYKKYLKDPKTPSFYHNLVKRYPDQVFRNSDEKFDGRTTPGIFIGPKTQVDLKLQARLLAAYDISAQFGAAYHSRFQDTYFTFPENAIVLYWPQEPLWVANAKPDLNLPDEEYVSVALPKNDREKKTSWTGLFYDKVSFIWMVTGSTPIYDGNEFLGSVHHDVMVTELVQRTINDHLQGASSYVVRSDGRLIAHPDHLEDIKKQEGKYDIKLSNNSELINQFKIINATPDKTNIISDDYDNYLAVAKIAGPEWYLVFEYPRDQIRNAAMANVGFLLGAGFFSLVLELIVLFFVLRREVTLPLLKLVNSTKTVAGGNYVLDLEKFENREDELGLLATSFVEMTFAINDRDKKLARHNEDLESLIEERTRELDEQKTLNIQASKLSSLGEMAGGIAHEINTPLATVKLLASQAQQEISEGIPDLDNLSISLEQIDQTVDRVAKIVKGLKSFSRDGSSDPVEVVDFCSIIEDTISLCSERCRQHGIELRIEKPSTPLPITCRSVQLGQVLLNLVNNAYDAVEHSDPKWIEIKIDDGEEFLEIRVIDSGPGIPKEVRDKIFNPFFTTKSIGKGTGLGLSISHGIIKSHQGKLSIDEFALNTSFVIFLPKKPKSLAAA